MTRELYYLPLFTEAVTKIMDECCRVLEQGKRVIYIAPSRELIFAVRNRFIERCGGIINVDVGGFEIIEDFMLVNHFSEWRKINEATALIILAELCRELLQQGKLIYYKKVACKQGFLKSVYAVIKKLKRLHLSPVEFHQKVILQQNNPLLMQKCDELYLIYFAYQQRLAGLKLMDVDDISMQAVELVGMNNVLDDVELIVIDGYMNIDPVHRALLARIIEHYPELRIICHAAFKTPATEEFMQQEIISDCQMLGFVAASDTGAEIPAADSIKRIARQIFTLPVSELKDGDNINILNAPCIADEIRQVARIIKKLISEEGIKPEAVALVLNQLSDYEANLFVVFDEMGIPLNVGRHEPLLSQPLFRDLWCVLTANGQAAELERVIASPYFEIGDAVLNQAAIFPQTACLGDYIKQTQELIRILQIEEKLMEKYHSAAITFASLQRDLKVLAAFRELLAELATAYQLAGVTQQSMEYTDYLTVLQDAAASVTVMAERPQSAGVSVLDHDRLRGVRYHAVFILGLNEGSYPLPFANDGIFNVKENEALFNIGISINNSAWELAREKVRFISTCAAANKLLYLSYRSAAEIGAYMIKSSFLEEIEGMLTPETLAAVTNRKRFMRDRFKNTGDLWSSKEAIQRIITACWQDKDAGLNELQPYLNSLRKQDGAKIFDSVNSAGMMEISRQLAPQFDEYDGLLSGVNLKQHTADYNFSASQINKYNQCPFRYYLEHVLGLNVFPDDTDLTPQSEGAFYHAVLKQYYTGNATPAIYDNQRLQDCFQEVLSTINKINMDAVIFKLRIDGLRQTIESFLEKDTAYLNNYYQVTGNNLKPVYLEKHVTDTSFAGCRFTANIDRVDLEFSGGRPTGKFVMYDYKRSSVPSLKELITGGDYQLAIYYFCILEALHKEQGIANPECLGLFYYSIRKLCKDGFVCHAYKAALSEKSKRNTVPAAQFAELLAFLKARVEQLVAAIKGGRFTLPAECGQEQCDYAKICRFDRYRLANKQGVK